jgi:hypothetical protein
MFSANENIQLRQYKKQIVQWVEATMPEDVLDMGVNVMVMQVACKTPGCVPIETAIIIVFPTSDTELLPGLPESKGDSYKTKILKPMSMVNQQDVLEALPPEFEGGLRSVEKLCINARDVMLSQITKLFGVEDAEAKGRTLMARYLQQALQDYIDRDCVPPEWGEAFAEPTRKYGVSSVLDETKVRGESANNTDANGKAAANYAGTSQTSSSSFASKGNIVLKRPTQDRVSVLSRDSNVLSSSASNSRSSYSASQPPTSTRYTPVNLQSASSAHVNRQGSTQSQSDYLAQLKEIDHAPGVRRAGCPCCDPDNPANVADSMMNL